MEVGVFLPADHPDPKATAAAARTAEELGIESAWTGDHIIGRKLLLDSGMALAAAATATSRLKVGYASFFASLHPLLWAAKQVASLQFLSQDRLLFGVTGPDRAWERWRGGFGVRSEWAALGVPYEENDERTDALLAALPDLLAGKPLDGVEFSPTAPVPPVLVGGSSDRALERVLEFGDGWFPALLPPELVKAGADRLRAGAEQAGRPVPDITLALPFVVGTRNVEAKRAEMAASTAELYELTPDQASRILLLGGTADIADQLSPYIEAGVTRFVLSTPAEDWRAEYEAVAKVQEFITR